MRIINIKRRVKPVEAFFRDFEGNWPNYGLSLIAAQFKDGDLGESWPRYAWEHKQKMLWEEEQIKIMLDKQKYALARWQRIRLQERFL